MPCLVIETDGQNKESRTIELHNEAIIGREKSNNVYIDDERASRKHAKVTKEPDGSFLLVDLGSRNGMIVNNERVSRRNLIDKDRIVIGRTTLTYNESAPASAQPTASAEILQKAKTLKASTDEQSSESAKLGSDALKKAIQDLASGRPEDKTTIDSKKATSIASVRPKNTQTLKKTTPEGEQGSDEQPSSRKRILVFLVFLIFFVTILLFAREMTTRLLSKAEKSHQTPNTIAPETTRNK